MSISHPISRMCPPVPGEKVPGATFSYFNARNRRRIFNFLIDELKKSGITRTELATRTGKSLALISRLLGQPSNLTADTAAELLFAISGGEIEYNVTHPLNRRAGVSPPTRTEVVIHKGSEVTETTTSGQGMPEAIPRIARQTTSSYRIEKMRAAA
jgi:transcriptional regulator with XRE-family HTH domain